jgi:ABC-type uncharacterized transport system substrate-binding protein
MRKVAVVMAVGMAIALLGATPLQAAGVFVVSPKGVEAFEGAKAGFIQMAYGVQMPGLNPKTVDLDGSAADDAALSALAAQNPAVVFAVGAQAVRKVRKAMPEVWIVYGMVYFPESEGFLNDPKMVGVASLGPAKGLAADIKAFTKSKAVVVLHAQAESATVSALLDRLRAEGLDPQSKSVPSSPDLPAAFDAVKDNYKTVILLPDGITASPDSMRFLISQCVQGGILPVALAEPLVASGALLAAYYPSEAVGNQAARLAADLVKTGNAPADKLYTPAESATALNKSTAQALKINVPKTFRVEVTYE